MIKTSNYSRNISIKNVADDINHKITTVLTLKTGAIATIIGLFIVSIILIIMIHNTVVRIILGVLLLIATVYFLPTITALDTKSKALTTAKQNILKNHFSILEDKVIKTYPRKIRYGFMTDIQYFAKTRHKTSEIPITESIHEHAKKDDILYMVRESESGTIITSYLAKHTILDDNLSSYVLPYNLLESHKLPTYNT